MIKVLVVAKDLQVQGISKVIMNYFHFLKDKDVEMDLAVGQPIEYIYKENIEKAGRKLYALPSKSTNSVEYYLELYKVMKMKKYNIVHVHGNSATITIELFLGLLAGIPVRIAHSHNSTCNHVIVHKTLKSIMRSLFLPAITDRTRFPAAFKALIIGSIGATPTPPPAHTTVPKFSMCVGFPSGPTTSAMTSPSLSPQSFCDDSPTRCTTIVIVPLFTSASAMVRGIRSPFLSTLIIMKLPAFLLFAISGASISNKNTFSENCSLRRILFIKCEMLLYLFCSGISDYDADCRSETFRILQIREICNIRLL